MEGRMRRSRNAAPWPAEGLVGGKGKRNAEGHQEGRIHFVHHGTPTHSQHQRILALQLLLWEMSESMGNHDSEVVDASSVD
jgi:hypothetical protein